jgi:hypothetical protein
MSSTHIIIIMTHVFFFLDCDGAHSSLLVVTCGHLWPASARRAEPLVIITISKRAGCARLLPRNRLLLPAKMTHCMCAQKSHAAGCRDGSTS